MGGLVKGTVVAIEKDTVLVDIGFKSEGRVPIKEFTPPDKRPELGDEVEVFLNTLKTNLEMLSYQGKEQRETAWEVMEKALKNKDQVKGNIFSRVKGRFSVDLNDAIAFLPGSSRCKVIKDNSYLLGTEQIFHI